MEIIKNQLELDIMERNLRNLHYYLERILKEHNNPERVMNIAAGALKGIEPYMAYLDGKTLDVVIESCDVQLLAKEIKMECDD